MFIMALKHGEDYLFLGKNEFPNCINFTFQWTLKFVSNGLFCFFFFSMLKSLLKVFWIQLHMCHVSRALQDKCEKWRTTYLHDNQIGIKK